MKIAPLLRSAALVTAVALIPATTATMAQAVIAGATDALIEGVEIRTQSALEATPEDVLWADAVILGTPENFGYMSGALKHFFDTVYYPCLDHTQGLPDGLFIKAGNDGLGAQSAIERIITGLRWRELTPPVIRVGDVDAATLTQCRELGMTVAAGLEAGLF